jgi:PRTRC genetic system protein C
MQIQQTERVFRYSGGLVLPDPDPSLGIEAVRQVYASSYPEIITAAVRAGCVRRVRLATIEFPVR